MTGLDARGLVLLPDEWSLPAGCTFNPSSGNSYDAVAWEKMEAAGAVFLPAAGYRDGSSVSDVNWKGHYRASTLFQSDDAGFLEFNYVSSISTAAGFPTGDNLYFGMAVRLVSDCL